METKERPTVVVHSYARIGVEVSGWWATAGALRDLIGKAVEEAVDRAAKEHGGVLGVLVDADIEEHSGECVEGCGEDHA